MNKEEMKIWTYPNAPLKIKQMKSIEGRKKNRYEDSYGYL